jgi:hypothetical protein
MSGRTPEKFVLKRKDRARLLELLRDGQTPLKVARRALILLGRATGEQSIAALEEKVADRATIWRFARATRAVLETALHDAPHPGRPQLPRRTPDD